MCFTTATATITNESSMSHRVNNTRTLRRKKRTSTTKASNSNCPEEKELSSFFHRSLSCLFTTTSSSVQEELEPHKLNSPKKRRLSSASTGTLPTCPSSDASFSSASPSFATTSIPSHLPLPTTISTQSMSSTTTSSGLQHKHKSRSIGKLSQKDSLCSLGGLLVSGLQRPSPPSDSSVVAGSDATTDSLRSCTLSQYLSDLDASFDSRARFHRSQDDDHDDDDSLSYSDDSSLGDKDHNNSAVGWYVDSSPQSADDDEDEEDAIFF